MTDFVILDNDKNLSVVEAKKLENKELCDFRIVIDTEYSLLLSMLVNAIGCYIPELDDSKVIAFNESDLSENFNPIVESLNYLGIECKLLSEDFLYELQEILNELSQDFSEQNKEQNGHALRKTFDERLENGDYDDFLNEWELERENLVLSRIGYKEDRQYVFTIQLPIVKCKILMFFAPADIFKIWGQNCQDWLLYSKLYQYRSLRLMEKTNLILQTKNGLVELEIELRDTMYRLPPIDKSLNGQARAFALSGGKIDIVNRQISDSLGLKSPNEIMESIHKLYDVFPELAKKYNAQDIFLTSKLDETQQKFLDLLRESFELESVPIADTTGKNVSNIISDLIYKHFKTDSKDKRISQAFKLSKIDNLQYISSNHFGIDPFLTVGGLLFSRVARHPVINGLMGDLDLKSCYATSISNINVYIGEPKCLTFRHKKHRPKLSKALEIIKALKLNNDAWYVRVSGEFDKVWNTLLPSDLRFSGKQNKLKGKFSLLETSKSVEQFNAEKVGKQLAESCILLKEVCFGLITHHTALAIIDLMPSDWIEEYLNLSVDALVFVPNEMIVESVDDYESLFNSLPEESENEEMKELSIVTTTQNYNCNVCLKFPISEYWDKLRKTRNQYKKEKNPVQEVFKIVGNSGFGALACPHLKVNNPMAANQITASARVAAWIMTCGLNATNPITDGSVFCWDNIPIGKTFKELIDNNPEYMFDFDPGINSGLTHKLVGQDWIDESFKEHLSNFYQISLNHELINLFDYELKTEYFLTSESEKTLSNWIKSLAFEPTDNEVRNYIKEKNLSIETDKFTGYVNSGAGNYVKIMNDCHIFKDGNDYDFAGQTGEIKARSYSSKRDSGLLPWYVESISNEYEQPYLYQENSVIKFGDGNKLAVKFLSHKTKTITKSHYESVLSEEEKKQHPIIKEFDEKIHNRKIRKVEYIIKYGIPKIAHPMGFSTTSYKSMKLITRSQFLFLNKSQLRNFEKNEESVSRLSSSNLIGRVRILGTEYWENVTDDDLKPYETNLIDEINYQEYAYLHPVGIGFELLCFNRGYDGSIKKVRELILKKILDGCKDFNAGLNIGRSIKHAENFKHFLASIIVKRANAEYNLKSVLIESSKQPTIFTVKTENIKTLSELWQGDDE